MGRRHLLAQKIFRELAVRGVHLNPAEDLDEIALVLLAARRVCDPTDPVLERRLLNPVVQVGRAALRSVPIGIEAVVDRLTAHLPENGVQRGLAQAYAAAHTTEVDFWQAPPGPREFGRLVLAWAKDVGVTRVELATALRELQEREYDVLDKVAAGGDAVDLHRIVECLVREYGHDVDYWIWQASSDQIEALLSAMAQRADEEQAEIAKAARDGKHPLMSPNQYSVRAMSALLKLRDQIVAAHTAPQEPLHGEP